MHNKTEYIRRLWNVQNSAQSLTQSTKLTSVLSRPILLNVKKEAVAQIVF